MSSRSRERALTFAAGAPQGQRLLVVRPRGGVLALPRGHGGQQRQGVGEGARVGRLPGEGERRLGPGAGRLQLAPPDEQPGEVRAGRRGPVGGAVGQADGDALLPHGLRGRRVAPHGEEAGALQHGRPMRRGRRRAGEGQRAGRPDVALLPVAPAVPEPAQGPGEAQGVRPVPLLDVPGQGRPQVVVLRLQAGVPAGLVRALQLRHRPLGEGQEVAGVGAPHPGGLAALRQALQGVLAHRLQQPVPHAVCPRVPRAGNRADRRRPPPRGTCPPGR